MTLRHVILDFLYEHVEGHSYSALFQHWWKIMPDEVPILDDYRRTACLLNMLALMVRNGELEQPRFSWYRLPMNEWLTITLLKQRCSISSIRSQDIAVGG